MDAVAQAILDVGLGKDSAPKALNFVHPRPITWTSMITSIREALVARNKLDAASLPLISFGDWVARLGEQAKNAKDEDLQKIVGASNWGLLVSINVLCHSLPSNCSISSRQSPRATRILEKTSSRAVALRNLIRQRHAKLVRL